MMRSVIAALALAGMIHAAEVSPVQAALADAIAQARFATGAMKAALQQAPVFLRHAKGETVAAGVIARAEGELAGMTVAQASQNPRTTGAWLSGRMAGAAVEDKAIARAIIGNLPLSPETKQLAEEGRLQLEVTCRLDRLTVKNQTLPTGDRLLFQTLKLGDVTCDLPLETERVKAQIARIWLLPGLENALDAADASSARRLWNDLQALGIAPEHPEALAYRLAMLENDMPSAARWSAALLPLFSRLPDPLQAKILSETSIWVYDAAAPGEKGNPPWPLK